MPGKGKPFPKGNTIAKGRPALTKEQKLIRERLKKMDGKYLLAKYAMMKHGELKKLPEDAKDNLPSIEIFIIKLIETGIAKADLTVLSWIYDKFGWNEPSTKTDDGQLVVNFNVLSKKVSDENENY